MSRYQIERIRAKDVASMLGIGVRCVQQMAARGNLPSAARIGKVWTFDPSRIRAYVADAEARCQSRISINEMEFGGFERPSTELKSARAYESAMLKLLGKDATKNSKGSRRRGQGRRRQHGNMQ